MTALTVILGSLSKRCNIFHKQQRRILRSIPNRLSPNPFKSYLTPSKIAEESQSDRSMETDDNVCSSMGSFINKRLLLCCLQLYRSQHIYFHEGRTGSHRYRGDAVIQHFYNQAE